MSEKAIDAGRLPGLGEIVGGKFCLERVVGRGGMGTVFAARNTLTGKQVAIKWLLSSDANSVYDDVIKEAQAVCRIKHPNIVEVYDVAEDRGTYFIVMELLHGESLEEYSKRLGPLDSVPASCMLIEIMEGIAAAHQAGIVHRDLKLGNIVVQHVGNDRHVPKVIDFGIAERISNDARPAADGVKLIRGSLTTMSPGALRGHASEARTDVYSLGVMLFQLLTGCGPFLAIDHAQMLEDTSAGTPPSIRDVLPRASKALAKVVHKAMAFDRNERFASVEEFARALELFAGGRRFTSALSAQAPGAHSKPRKAQQRATWTIVALAALATSVREPTQFRPEGEAELRQVLLRVSQCEEDRLADFQTQPSHASGKFEIDDREREELVRYFHGCELDVMRLTPTARERWFAALSDFQKGLSHPERNYMSTDDMGDLARRLDAFQVSYFKELSSKWGARARAREIRDQCAFAGKPLSFDQFAQMLQLMHESLPPSLEWQGYTLDEEYDRQFDTWRAETQRAVIIAMAQTLSPTQLQCAVIASR